MEVDVNTVKVKEIRVSGVWERKGEGVELLNSQIKERGNT